MNKCKHRQLISIDKYDMCFNCPAVFINGKLQKIKHDLYKQKGINTN